MASPLRWCHCCHIVLQLLLLTGICSTTASSVVPEGRGGRYHHRSNPGDDDEHQHRQRHQRLVSGATDRERHPPPYTHTAHAHPPRPSFTSSRAAHDEIDAEEGPSPHTHTRVHAHTPTRVHAHTHTRAHAHTHTRRELRMKDAFDWLPTSRAERNRLLWRFDTGREIETEPVLSENGDVVYFGSSDGYLYAVSTSTGRELWKYQASGPVQSSPLLVPHVDVIVFGDSKNVLWCVNATSGQRLWGRMTQNAILTSPVLSPTGDVVYVGGTDFGMYAVDLYRAEVLWVVAANDSIYSSPALSPSGDMIYFGSNDHVFYSLNTTNGALVWGVKTDQTITCRALVSPDGTRAYVGGNDHRLYAFDAKTGVELWTYETLGQIRGSLAQSPNGTVVYVGSQDFTLYAVDSTTGQPLWSFQTQGPIYASAVTNADGTKLYLGSEDGHLYVIDARNGEMLWVFATATKSALQSTPCLDPVRDVLYFGSYDKALYAITVGNANLREEFDWPIIITVILLVLYFVRMAFYFHERRRRRRMRRLQREKSSVLSLSNSHTALLSTTNNNATSNHNNTRRSSSVSSHPDTTLLPPSPPSLAKKAKKPPAADAVTGGNGPFSSNGSSSVGIDRSLARASSTPPASSDPSRTHQPPPPPPPPIPNERTVVTSYMGSGEEGGRGGGKGREGGDGAPAGTSGGVTLGVAPLPPHNHATAAARDDTQQPHRDSEGGGGKGKTHMNNPTWARLGAPHTDPPPRAAHNSHTHAHTHAHTDTKHTGMRWADDDTHDGDLERFSTLSEFPTITSESDLKAPMSLGSTRHLSSMSSTASGFYSPFQRPYLRLVDKLFVYFLTGCMFGLGVGGVASYVEVALQSAMPPYVEVWRYYTVPFSVALLVCALWMGCVWCAWALVALTVSKNPVKLMYRMTQLSAICVLITAQLVSINAVPALFVLRKVEHGLDAQQAAAKLGSHLRVFISWMVLSYPLGALTIALGLGYLEVLLTVVEDMTGRIETNGVTGWRALRLLQTRLSSSFIVEDAGQDVHHREWMSCFVRRWHFVVQGYNWGFLMYWVTTMTTMYFFNQHKEYVPPYTPLAALGVCTGVCALLVMFYSASNRKTDFYGWTKERCWEIRAYLDWVPTRRNRALVKRWRSMTQHVYRSNHPLRLLRLAFNATVPNIWNLRQKISRWTGMRLSPTQGSQSTLYDEIDWAFILFSVNSLMACFPLIIFWLYQRYQQGRVLILGPPYVTFARDDNVTFGVPRHPPIKVIPDQNPDYLPMIYSGQSPFHKCSYMDWTSTVDPGDFNVCQDRAFKRCMAVHYNATKCGYATCDGIATTILAEPSRSLWFHVKLLVYGAFLLYCLWVIALERNEKVYLSVAHHLGGILKDDVARGNWWLRVSRVIAPLYLVFLGGIYAAALAMDDVKQSFLLFRDMYDMLDVEKAPYRNQMQLPDSANLTWFCEALPEQFFAILVTYAANNLSDDLPIAIIEGLFFGYQCWALLVTQKQVYTFLDADALLTHHLEPEEDTRETSYWHVLQHRDNGRLVTKDVVDEHLHQEVYLPFFAEVYERRPDVIYHLFNREEVEFLVQAVNDREMRKGAVMIDEGIHTPTHTHTHAHTHTREVEMMGGLSRRHRLEDTGVSPRVGATGMGVSAPTHTHTHIHTGVLLGEEHYMDARSPLKPAQGDTHAHTHTSVHVLPPTTLPLVDVRPSHAHTPHTDVTHTHTHHTRGVGEGAGEEQHMDVRSLPPPPTHTHTDAHVHTDAAVGYSRLQHSRVCVELTPTQSVRTHDTGTHTQGDTHPNAHTHEAHAHTRRAQAGVSEGRTAERSEPRGYNRA